MSISEDLKARVRKKFNELYSNDEKISKQWSAIQSGSATYEEAHAYGERLGDLIREALNEVTVKISRAGAWHTTSQTRS